MLIALHNVGALHLEIYMVLILSSNPIFQMPHLSYLLQWSAAVASRSQIGLAKQLSQVISCARFLLAWVQQSNLQKMVFNSQAVYQFMELISISTMLAN